jgi:hypothetical protein
MRRAQPILAATVTLCALFMLRALQQQATVLQVTPRPPESTESVSNPLTSWRATESGGIGKCAPLYSKYRCVDAGSDTFVGTEGDYGLPIYNRSCLYENLLFDAGINKFVFYAAPSFKGPLPLVTLSPRAFDLPIMGWKRRKVKNKMRYYHEWAPAVVRGAMPCDVKPGDNVTYAYYSPIVAPWNYAHTLLCDLFGLLWAAVELGVLSRDLRVIAVGAHYASDFPLPNKNAAFRLFSTVPPTYEGGIPRLTVIRRLVAGSGTKSWSWVTERYAAAGDDALWWRFRRHVIDTVGATDRARDAITWEGRSNLTRKPRVSICHKKDKRGVVNYEEALAFLQKDFPQADFALESAVGKTPQEQVQMMVDADVYICNEGTLATSFFLMPPGSAFVSLPLVYHAAHLHQLPGSIAKPDQWWREPDKMRPDPRKNTGGNIDWFPPAIPWVRVSWYDKIPMNETRIQLPLASLRNYQPEFNIVLQRRRLRPLVERALNYVTVRRGESDVVVRNPNYSVNADLCRQLLALTPNLTRSFNTGRCYYGMSWLCELWTNTHYRWRLFHEKWKLSKGRCGSNRSWPAAVGIPDPRESDPERPLSEYLFYTRERLAELYERTDLGPTLKASPEDLVFF